jgi:hypothetical protein
MLNPNSKGPTFKSTNPKIVPVLYTASSTENARKNYRINDATGFTEAAVRRRT